MQRANCGLMSMLECPIPISRYPEIRLAHGGGGKLMQRLIKDLFAAAFDGLGLQLETDAAVVDATDRIAFTTDSFVVNPLQFPGGDIGKLAVCGTVNDLATSGARPAYLSASFILEEGLSMETLWEIANSMRSACEEAGVSMVTGDTKVVDRGHGDGVFITTSGVGTIDHDLVLQPSSIELGDAILLTGDLGRHGMAIMALRESLGFESEIESDCAPLNHIVHGLLESDVVVRCARDLTRGGLAAAANEVADASGETLFLNEAAIPVREDVRAACEVLGLDPLYVANEGRMMLVVPSGQADLALTVIKSLRYGENACRIGEVRSRDAFPVVLRSTIGIDRILDLLTGEQLPRIC